MPVIIKPIRGFPGYSVGTDGSVWSYWRLRGRVSSRGTESYISALATKRKSVLQKSGYYQVLLRKDGKYFAFLVHRLVLDTFRGPCPEGMEALHGDGDRGNNKVSNLRWGTKQENVQDAIRHGTFYNATKAAAIVNTGRIVPTDVRLKIATASKGKPKSEAHKAALKANHWSKRMTSEMSAKMRAAGRKGLLAQGKTVLPDEPQATTA